MIGANKEEEEEEKSDNSLHGLTLKSRQQEGAEGPDTEDTHLAGSQQRCEAQEVGLSSHFLQGVFEALPRFTGGLGVAGVSCPVNDRIHLHLLLAGRGRCVLLVPGSKVTLWTKSDQQ